MSSVVAAVATWLLFVIAAGGAAAWVAARRGDRLPFALTTVVAVGAVGALVKLMGAIWNDPRPFVIDQVAPLIAHSPDNGFPSDHTAMAFAVATVVLLWNRRTGVALLLLALILGAARVLAGVHHVPDIVAGAGVGIAAALLADAGVRVILPRWSRLTRHRAAPLPPG